MKSEHLRRDARFRVGSVFLRQQNGGCRAVGFGDEPDFGAVRKAIGGENPEPFLEGQFVLLAVVFVDLAPIAGNMAADE